MVRIALILLVTAGCASSKYAGYDDSYGYGYDDAPTASRVERPAGGIDFSDVGGPAPPPPADVPEEGRASERLIAQYKDKEVDDSLLDSLMSMKQTVAGASYVRVAKAPDAPPLPAASEPPPTSKRLMVYRASYGVMVASVDESIDKFLFVVEGVGGYLQSRTGGEVTVRVPAAHFQRIVDELPGMGRITARNLAALDVTKQYSDLAIRIENAESARARLLDLLKQATKMEDILAIEREVRRLSEEIETMKGEQKYLADQIALSTITVAFRANAPEPLAYPERQRSRFEWINAVGLERVLYDF